MKQLLVLNKVLISVLLLIFLTTSCNTKNIVSSDIVYDYESNIVLTKEKAVTNDIDKLTNRYTISFFDSSSINNLGWSDERSFKIIKIQNMLDSSVEKVVNENIVDAMTSWISGKIINASSVDLEISCHSSQYLSFVNCFEYYSDRVDYINDYITIDLKTGKRIMLNDLIQIDKEFVKYVQKNNLIKESTEPERYGGSPEHLWTFLNEFTSDELLEEFEECSKTQLQMIQHGYYPIEESIGSLLFRNSFYLRDEQIVIVLFRGGETHITFNLDDISDFLKVEKW